MCGLVGYCSYGRVPEHVSLLENLAIQSKIRGLHAFGMSHLTAYAEHATTVKFFNVGALLSHIRHAQYDDAIIHARYSTSGDWTIESNNQPLNLRGYSLVFNGVISMKTKTEMEDEFGVDLCSDNDGELFIHHLLSGGSPQQFVTEIAGSFAGLWYTPDGELYAIRNARRPLWYFHDVFDGGVFFASTKDIITRAVNGNTRYSVPIECEPGLLYNLEAMCDDSV